MSAPLAGTRVIDLTHLIAGPFCTMLLADAGADVLKIEPPGGDIARRRIPFQADGDRPGVSGYFLAVNRGKRSIVLDLKTDQGRLLLDELISHADVLVENYRPGVLDRLGLGIDDLRNRHPSLIIASISAFGKEHVPDDLREAPGLAIVAEAMSGITSRTRDSADRPIWCGFPLGDFTAGLTAQAAILGALIGRSRDGSGAWIDISMADAMLAFNASSFASDTFSQSQSAPSASTTPYGVFPASDGFVAIGVNSDRFWGELCQAMEQAGLASDPRFLTQQSRAEHREIVSDLVNSWTCRRSRSEVVSALQRSGVPVGPVNDAADLARSELFSARAMLRGVSDGRYTSASVPASAQGYEIASTRAPLLGEHTDQILEELLGITASERDRLREKGVLGDA